jgi:DNA polymerase-3 subunit alpha
MKDDAASLKSLVYNGAQLKRLEMNDVVLDRLNHELSIIEKLNLIDYFLTYSKIVEICNTQNILRSYGRGSACGSLVNYCLDITKIDPLKEGLIFERFLNPDLSKFADIDIDIPFGYQKLIIEKLKMELPDHFIYNLAFLPTAGGEAYEKVIIDEIFYKKHPCGIIISLNKIPLPIGEYNNTEYYYTNDYRNITSLNNFKFDILELEYLNKLEQIVKLVGNEYHPYKLPSTDKKVFSFFKNGDRSNIFRFNTDYIGEILHDFEPTSINDLTIINSLNRPDSIENIPFLINNKQKGYFDHYQNDRRVDEILKETYGLLVFQETFMHLLYAIAGFSYTEADIYRRILSKINDKEKNSEFISKFKSGCKQNSSLNFKQICQLETMILEKIPMAFNKSHSMCYSTIAYWGAYYKVNFEKEFDYVFNKKASND